MRSIVKAAGIVSAVALGCGPGHAADLETGHSSSLPSPIWYGAAYDWTGAYVGLHTGLHWMQGRERVSIPEIAAPLVPRELSGSASNDSVLAGVHLGLNRQIGNWVLGGEIGGGFLGSYERDCRSNLSIIPVAASFSCDVTTNWAAHGTLKLGYAFDRVLVYGTGGWAVAGLEYRISGTVTGFPATVSHTLDKTAEGFVLGGGIEYAMTDRLSLGLEYTRFSFDVSASTEVPASLLPAGVLESDSRISGAARGSVDAVKLRLNYKLQP